MRLLLGAAVAALLFTVPAVAQEAETHTSACAALPPALTDLPDGAAATRRQMDAANERFVAWAETIRPVLECRRQEAASAQARAAALTQQFNSDAAAFTGVVTAWQAEAEEFNAGGNNNRR